MSKSQDSKKAVKKKTVENCQGKKAGQKRKKE